MSQNKNPVGVLLGDDETTEPLSLPESNAANAEISEINGEANIEIVDMEKEELRKENVQLKTKYEEVKDELVNVKYKTTELAPVLNELQTRILVAIFKHGTFDYIEHLRLYLNVHGIDLELEIIKYHLQILEEQDYIKPLHKRRRTMSKKYEITHKGRKYIIKNNLS